MPERDGKDQEEDVQRKRARAGSLTIVDCPQVSGAFIRRTFSFADDVFPFSGVSMDKRIRLPILLVVS